MTRTFARSRCHSLPILALALTTLALALPAPAAAQQPERPTVLIKVNNMGLNSAHTLAQGVCQHAAREVVRDDSGNETTGWPTCYDVEVLPSENVLAVTATPEVVSQIRTLLAEVDRTPETHAFQVVLLAATRTGTMADDVPANVRSALTDLRDFLPYTGFSVVGSAWLRTASYGSTTLPGAEEFIAELRFRPSSDAQAPLLVEDFSVFRQIPVPMQGSTQFMRRNVVQTTFTIDRGETVVVGTSKLNGDDTAVVVLLTAVQD